MLALPKSVNALADYAERLAAWGKPSLVLVAVGRNQHMTPRQNAALARSFGEVMPQRGVGKCRAIVARLTRPRTPSWPRLAVEPTTGLTLAAHGLTFAGNRLDAGTRLLLSTCDRWPGGKAVDFGCGNGILTAVLARQGRHVTAVDVSRAAIASTRATLAANRLTATIIRTDGLYALPRASADLIVTNPPFHEGTAKESRTSLDMIADAPRVLCPRGELWCVFNAHLPYVDTARKVFRAVEVVTRDRSYVVMRATR